MQLKFIYPLLQRIYVGYAFLLFVVIMVILFPVVFALSCLGKQSGNTIYTICRGWAIFWSWMVGINHKTVGSSPNKSMQYVFVSNHISYMDIPAILIAIQQPVRILGKLEIAAIPLFGVFYKSVVVLLDRGNTKDRLASIQKMKMAILSGLSIFVFPEGTFNETGNPLKEFYNGAFQIAIQQQIPILPILLLDTRERLDYSSIFSLTPGKSRIVYLDPIGVVGLQISNTKQLKQLVFDKMEAALLEYKNS